MKDWAGRLDDFLTMTGNEILDHAGKVSHKNALDKAHKEYQTFKQQQVNELSKAEKDFIEQIDETHKELKQKKSNQ